MLLRSALFLLLVDGCIPLEPVYPEQTVMCADGESTTICLPDDYMKFELPSEGEATHVSIGVDIKDIPKVNDKDFSITINAYFIVKWQDKRLVVSKRNRTRSGRRRQGNFFGSTVSSEPHSTMEAYPPSPTSPHQEDSKLTAVNLQILGNLWLPDVEILNLKAFETHSVLSKLEGIWIDKHNQLLYALATRITFICPMKFNAFPMDIQVCKFQVGSFNYDMSKMVFRNEFVPKKEDSIKSILDYRIEINDLRPDETHYMALGMNYSVAGFEMVLTRKMSFYVVTYYLPSGLFVLVSWISFLVNPDVIPGRMTLLVTIFLVLINIFNTIQTNSPKAEGLTAIEAWVIACIIFVFGALGEYTVILLKIKLKKLYPKPKCSKNNGGSPNSRGHHHHLPGSMSMRRDCYARTDLTFLVVFPMLFILFNVCYWTALYWWRWSWPVHHKY